MEYWECVDPGADAVQALERLSTLRPVHLIGQAFNMAPTPAGADRRPARPRSTASWTWAGARGRWACRSGCGRRRSTRSGRRSAATRGGAGPGPASADAPGSAENVSVEDVDEALELAEVAALPDAVAVGAVLADDRVAGVPVRAGLGVEPVRRGAPSCASPPRPRSWRRGSCCGRRPAGCTVVFGRDVAGVLLPERLERVPVVGVPVDPDDVGLGVDPVDGLGDVLDALEVAR